MDIAIEAFLKESGELRPEGLLPKLEFFATTINELTGELRLEVERALLKHGIPDLAHSAQRGDKEVMAIPRVVRLPSIHRHTNRPVPYRRSGVFGDWPLRMQCAT